ncbi:DUF7262 family protein [Halopelagius longus]|uniref:Uncharacterized protein n=1 Tax=Halopelagius longus TaxID=1236180 RepID=A0A1H1DHN7_9EURY|nr:hypothetical protein [Halopelagius longus]RDI71337.1 hypothetical protein DWB78_06110 [Halopelagius longus]SDQ75983.1 hypothetical protein SAMN05216278_2420 [Halopelagius longus]
MRESRAESGERAQLATSLAEAVVGILLVAAVAAGFAVAPVGGDADAAPSQRLDRLASDALSVLAAEPPTGSGISRLTAACRSESAFENEREALATRLDSLLPDSVAYRLATPRGRVGYPPPDGLPAGRADRQTAGCAVTLRVWYV